MFPYILMLLLRKLTMCIHHLDRVKKVIVRSIQGRPLLTFCGILERLLSRYFFSALIWLFEWPRDLCQQEDNSHSLSKKFFLLIGARPRMAHLLQDNCTKMCFSFFCTSKLLY